MRVKDITPKYEGKFLNFYSITRQDGSPYEVISRKRINSIDDFNHAKYERADAVTIIALNQDHTQILLNYEWRVPVNDYIFEFPAGLIDGDESVEEAAKRELWEETGCETTKILEVLPGAYQSPGMTNERVALVVCEAAGTPTKDNLQAGEDIVSQWWTKDEVAKIFKDENYLFAARAQMFIWSWLNS